MKYRVELTEQAVEDALAAFDWIARDDPSVAARWFNGLERVISSLAVHPRRGAQAPENDAFDRTIRQILHGPYRVLYTIVDRRVLILHVRHGARLPLAGDDDESIATEVREGAASYASAMPGAAARASRRRQRSVLGSSPR